MIYPQNFEQKTGFDKLRGKLREYCLSPLGSSNVEQMSFSTDFETIDFEISETDEFRNIYQYDDPFPAQDYYDLTGELNHVRIQNTYLEQEKMVELKLSLEAITRCIDYITNRKEEQYPLLHQRTSKVYIKREIITELERIINEYGDIRDHASDKLFNIRKELEQKKGSIDRTINKTLQKARSEGWLKDDAEITIRGGRMVIPVPAINKRKIKGFIHDESATGQTVYIEPTEVFDINNEIRELMNAEKREIIKILTEFTNQLRPHIDELLAGYEYLGYLDFLRSKAKLAVDLDAVKPDLHDHCSFSWLEARHPLLYLAYKNTDRSVVPLDIGLDKKQRILVISGPNAGGKSVCLKTVGLVQYMLQCGLLVPLKENSEAGIFKKILINIGDEQSLENDLSTYSSHLINIKYFIENLDEHSLFLIDEFGTGTEPQLGGAIAEAALEAMNKRNALGVITTHYANLKTMAGHVEGIVNGAMLFDAKEIRPLFQLRMGKPGSSYALEIARQIGFPENTLQNAEQKTGKSQVDFEKQLQELEVEKDQLSKKQDELKVTDDMLAEVLDKYKRLTTELETSKKEIIEKAREEARKILDDSNRMIEKTIKEIREGKADKEKTRIARQNLEQHKQKVYKEPGKQKKRKPEKAPETGPLKAGDTVKMKNQKGTGEIIELKGKEALVAFGDMRIKTPLNKLERAAGASKQKTRNSSGYKTIMKDIHDKKARFDPTIDVRGKRGEEAVAQVNSFIDEALLLGVKEVKIIHGKGNGILRSLIRDELSANQDVQRFYDEHVERGGQGITIACLNA
ncbi:MAG: Smr/MutS family protein [Bacteroidales bacterium]|nr:Smr/MutS family protein [Bacteroidales bacterium]